MFGIDWNRNGRMDGFDQAMDFMIMNRIEEEEEERREKEKDGEDDSNDG